MTKLAAQTRMPSRWSLKAPGSCRGEAGGSREASRLLRVEAPVSTSGCARSHAAYAAFRASACRVSFTYPVPHPLVTSLATPRPVVQQHSWISALARATDELTGTVSY